jgi:hypothetical protein
MFRPNLERLAVEPDEQGVPYAEAHAALEAEIAAQQAVAEQGAREGRQEHVRRAHRHRLRQLAGSLDTARRKLKAQA